LQTYYGYSPWWRGNADKATYLSDMRITVGRGNTRAKAYNDVIGKKHALFEGKGDVQLRSTRWKLIMRL